MKTNSFLIIISGIIISICASGQPRVNINLNNEWKFKSGSVTGAEKPTFDDSSWGSINLPHTWNNLDGQDGNGYVRGTGWYRKKINIPSAYQGRRIFIRFGAANLVSTIYVNGNSVGIHRGGYAAFIFDITQSVSYNAINTIAVKVDNTNTDSIAPLSADFTFCGGITRSVQLIVTDPVTISLTDYASPGIYISQNNVSAASAALSIKVLIQNYSTSVRNVTKTINIRDAKNIIVATDNESLSLAASSRTDRVRSFTIANPIL